MKDLSSVIWRDLKLYPGYQVSNQGDVRRNGKIRKQHENEDGYMRVILSIKGKPKSEGAHRLVAMAFVDNPKPNEYNVVNHKDLNKKNNTPDNLEWCTHKMNRHHAYQNGAVRFDFYGKKSKAMIEMVKRRVILTDKTTEEQRKFNSIQECADFLGLTNPALSHAIKRKSTIKKRYSLSFDNGLIIDKKTL